MDGLRAVIKINLNNINLVIYEEVGIVIINDYALSEVEVGVSS